MPRRMLRAHALALLIGLALLLGTTPASAHTQLESSDPADGASLATAPQSVSLTFNEAVQAGFTTVTVIGPDGVDYRSGATSDVDATVHAPVRALGPAGTYQIGYRAVAADGHPIAGRGAFTLTVAAPTPATAVTPTAAAVVPTATPDVEGGADEGRAPAWPWIVGAVVLVGGGVVAALRLGRG